MTYPIKQGQKPGPKIMLLKGLVAGAQKTVALANLDLALKGIEDGLDHLWKKIFAKEPNGTNIPTMHITICVL